MRTLNINLEKFGFVEREKINSQSITNRCGRDFAYYCLHYYYPNKFNPQSLNPIEIENKYLFGLQLPSWLMWTQLQFIKLPKYLKENNLKLFINGKSIDSFFDFVIAILFSPMTYADGMTRIERSVDEGTSVGVDIGLGYYGLLDHVMFVYGYDEDNLYVFDTNKVQSLEYYKIGTDNKFHMRLPKSAIKKRWGIFGRVWELRKLQTEKYNTDIIHP